MRFIGTPPLHPVGTMGYPARADAIIPGNKGRGRRKFSTGGHSYGNYSHSVCPRVRRNSTKYHRPWRIHAEWIKALQS